TSGLPAMFSRGNDNALWWKCPGRGTWSSLGGCLIGNPAAARNADGRVEVFVRGCDNAMYHNWQTCPGCASWSGWVNLYGGQWTSDPAAAMDVLGLLEVFARDNNGALERIYQTTSGGAWSGWISLGGYLIGNPTVTIDPATWGLTIFMRGGGGTVYRQFQCNCPTNNGWSGWWSMAGTSTSDVAVANNTGNRLELF